MDPPPPTCQFQVFRSVCKSIGLRSVIRLDAQELKKVKYLFPNKDMKEEFPDWFGSQIRQRHVDNDKDPEVSTTSELFALACGPTWTPISINSCVVNGVRYVVHNRDERRTTQNNGICSPGPDGEMYYGQLQEILEFKYLLFKVVLFRVKWFDTRNQGRKVKRLVLRNNMTQIDCRGEAFKNDQYILVTQVKQVFYLEDKAKPHLKVVEHVNHKKFSNGGVIMVEDDPDIIHFDNSSDLPLSTSLNDLDNATLHIDGQSTEVDAPPDIIDVVDQDDDITDDEDALPHDLADSDDEDLINVDDDGVDKMSADVARSYGGDGGGEDRPPPHHVPTGCGGCFANRGGRATGRLHTCDKTRNLSLKEITDKKGPVQIRFEVPKERKATLITNIGTQFDLRLDRDRRWQPVTLAKSVQYQQGCFQGPALGYRPRDRDLQCGEDQVGTSRGHYGGQGTRSAGARFDDEMEEMKRLELRNDFKYSEYVVKSYESGVASESGGCGDDEESGDDEEGEDKDGDRER
ncbi:hypothetical protein Tco_1430941 [Tanacetum coccineum]